MRRIIGLFLITVIISVGNLYSQESKDKENKEKKEEAIKQILSQEEIDKRYIDWAKSLSYEERFFLAKSWYIVALAYKNSGNKEKYERAYKRAIEIFPLIRALYSSKETNK